MSPTPENSEFPDDELNMQTMDFSHLNKLNKLSDLTITEDITEEELINMYRDSEVLEEQADILHYLFYNKYGRLCFVFSSCSFDILLLSAEDSTGRLCSSTMDNRCRCAIC